MNRHTLDLFEARNLQERQSRLGEMFRDDMHQRVIAELEQLWAGQLEFSNQTCNYTLGGHRLEVRLRARILQGHEATWERVLLTLEDVTSQEHAHQLLAQRERYAEELNRLSRKGPWPVSVMAIDLNGLKAINDEQGHAAGDALLRRAGEVLAKAAHYQAHHLDRRQGQDNL